MGPDGGRTGEPIIGFQQASVTNRIGGIVASPIYLRGMRQETSPENMGKEEVGVNETDEGADHMAEDILFDDEFNKAQEPGAVSDPGSPTAKEIATHNIPHLLHRARSTDRLHWASKESDEHAVPEFSFDNAFLWSKGEEERQAVQVGRDRRTGMRFAHLVPRNGLVSGHGAVEMLQDSDLSGTAVSCSSATMSPIW